MARLKLPQLSTSLRASKGTSILQLVFVFIGQPLKLQTNVAVLVSFEKI